MRVSAAWLTHQLRQEQGLPLWAAISMNSWNIQSTKIKTNSKFIARRRR